MSLSFTTLSKRLTLLENNLISIRLVKAKYYLQDASNKLSDIFGEKLTVWDVIDLAHEAMQNLYLDLEGFIADGRAYKLEQSKRVKIMTESKEYETNPFIKDDFCLDYVECIRFNNSIKCKRGDELVTYDKTLPRYVYLERNGLKAIIAMFFLF